MEARFRHQIQKMKKVIASFYLTIQTFFLIIAWYKLAILTFSELRDINSQLRVKSYNCEI